MSQIFEILIFGQDIQGNFHYILEINLISEGTLIKAFYSLNKTISKKFETRFCRRKTAGEDNANINVPPNIPCTFSKLIHFFKFSFRENRNFENVSFSQ